MPILGRPKPCDECHDSAESPSETRKHLPIAMQGLVAPDLPRLRLLAISGVFHVSTSIRAYEVAMDDWVWLVRPTSMPPLSPFSSMGLCSLSYPALIGPH